MAWTTLSFAFASLLTSTKMTQLQDNFTALAQGMSGAPQVLTAAIANANVNISKLAIGTGSWSGSIAANASVFVTLNSYGHIPEVGGSNSTNIKWSIGDGSGDDGAGSGVIQAKGTNKVVSPYGTTGHITWTYHT